MRRYLILFLISINSVVFFHYCAVPCRYNKIKATAFVTDSLQASPVEIDTTGKLLYRSFIYTPKKSFSGLFLFKKMAGKKTRIILLSEVGLRFMEFEYSDKEIELLYCVDFLNKNNIIKTFKKNILILLSDIHMVEKKRIFSDPGSSHHIFKTKLDEVGKCYYHFTNKQMTRTIYGSLFNKTYMEYSDYNKNNIPRKIEISYTLIDLGFSLKLIDNKNVVE